MPRSLVLLALGGTLAASAAAAAPSAATPPLPACNGPHASVLQAAPALPTTWAQARAAWLDGSRLRWAGASADGRYRLVASRTAQLRLAPGEPVRGADASLRLVPVAPAPDGDAMRRFSHIAAGATLTLAAPDRARLKALLQGQVLLVREDAQGRVLDATALQAAGALDALYAAAQAVPDLGATPRASATTFRLWAPTAQRVALCLYRDGTAPAQSVHALARDAASGVWSVRLPGNRSGLTYAYLVDVFVPGHGVVRNRVTDPYAVSLTTDSARGLVADLASPALKPAGWDATPRPERVRAATDQVIYELSVRDFSAGDASVSAPHRGKYLAFTETGSAGMRHLKKLSEAGVTDIHF
ncbi:MAG TPA: DUF3372 domain-containing protein, partial [Burkholderiaceae bacterium]|nr:DUF3372 domain-containing protein [Burkholderiaceae bacterium]